MGIMTPIKQPIVSWVLEMGIPVTDAIQRITKVTVRTEIMDTANSSQWSSLRSLGLMSHSSRWTDTRSPRVIAPMVSKIAPIMA